MEKIKFFNKEELKKIFNAIPKTKIRDRLIFLLMYRKGMRVSEIINLGLLRKSSLNRHFDRPD